MANPIDYAGMLTGISQDPQMQATQLLSQPSSAGIAGIAQANSAGRAERLERSRRGLGGLMGKDLRSPAQKVQEELKKLNPRDPKDQPKIVQLLSTIDQQKAFEIEAQFKAKQDGAIAQDERRSTLIQAALDLGLTSTAELLQNGGDMDKAAEQIRKQEEKDVVSQQGRKGKKAVAKSRNAGEAVEKAIDKGEYDGLSVSEFISTISGEDAELKVFNDASGVSRPFPVSKAGKVWNNVELNSKARDAQEILRTNKESVALLDREGGIKTGFGAEFFLNVSRVAKELGMVPKDMDNIAATEQYLILRAEQLMKIMPAFGAGSGLSDSDREVASKIALRDISMDEDALRALLRLEEKYARDLITKSNTALERSVAIGKGGLSPELAESYYIPLPAREGYSTPPNAAKYLPPQ